MSQESDAIKHSAQPNFYLWAIKRLLRDYGAIVGLVILGLLFLSAAFAPQLAPNEPYRLDPPNRLATPGELPQYPLGTDEGGRCILTRALYGGRLSLRVGFTATGFGAVIGVMIGVIGAYYRSLDNLLLRFMDIMMAIPSILLAIAIVSVLGPGLNNVMIAVGIGMIPVFARVTRSQVISLKEQAFVEAARAAGGKDDRIIRKHILVNIVPVLIVFCTLNLAAAIMIASVLSFLGMGVPPPAAEWGMMASAGRQYFLEAPHVTTIPSMFIMMAILSLNLLGDTLRDVLDPKLRQ